MKNKTKMTIWVTIVLLIFTAILYSCKTNIFRSNYNSLTGKYDTTFFDKDWNKCKQNKAKYYRVIEKNETNFIVKDMYLNNNPQMIAVCSSIDPLVKSGKCTYYNKNGIKSREGNYTKDKKIGTWILWENNRQDSSIVEYRADGTRNWIRFSDTMKNKEKNGVYDLVEKMPQFPGGDKARIKYLDKNIIYPYYARKRGIQGKVFVTFIVEKNGSLTNVKILRGIGGGCDEEVIRIVKNMPKWKPGTIDSKPVRVQFNMPILFKLNKK